MTTTQKYEDLDHPLVKKVLTGDVTIYQLDASELTELLSCLNRLVPDVEEQHLMQSRIRKAIPMEIGLDATIDVKIKSQIYEAAEILYLGELEALIYGAPNPKANVEDILKQVEQTLSMLTAKPRTEDAGGPLSVSEFIDAAKAWKTELELNLSSLSDDEDEAQSDGDNVTATFGAVEAAFWMGLNLQVALGKEGEELAVVGEKHYLNPKKGGDTKAANARNNNPDLGIRQEELASSDLSPTKGGKILASEFGITDQAGRKRIERIRKKHRNNFGRC